MKVFLEDEENSRKMNKVVQKYIENPLLRDSQKMDIRMWVLITDWDPVTVWSHEECYFRLAYSTYDLENNDVARHITNHNLEEGDNLVSLSDIKVQLTRDYGSNAWDEKIYPRMQQVIKATVSAA